MVRAVEKLSQSGIAVSVAAGNDGANACYGSPNSASSAIVSGAFDSDDSVTYWSNIGQCVDIFSPGLDIVSACAETLCPGGDGKKYFTMSGTSMACPHTTGVLAQLLEKNPLASPAQLAQALTCEAARSQLVLDNVDTVSRNLLLQTPRTSDSFNSCGIGIGCPASCSGKGLCAPARVGDNSTICHCDKGLFGTACGVSSGVCKSKSTLLKMADDGAGGGWSYAKFAIADSNGLVVENALDSMPQGESGVDTRQYCLSPGKYSFRVTRGLDPPAVLWALCGFVGGAPFQGDFIVGSSGPCSFHCDYSTVSLTLSSKSNSGWHGAYYAIYAESTGVQIYGGTLTSEDSTTQPTCLRSDCYLLFLERQGDSPHDVSFEACGVQGSHYDVIRMCIDSSGKCTASIVNSLSAATCNSSSTPIAFNMFSPSLSGWGGNRFLLSRGNDVMSTGWEGGSGFFSHSSLCLEDGCYSYAVSGDNSSAYSNSFWLTCGIRGHLPWNTQLCVDNAYQLCYGLTGCPVIKSYARTHNRQWYVVYDDLGQLLAADNLHSVHELCELEDGCYNMFVGAGITYDPAVFNSVELCETPMTMHSRARFCVEGSIYTYQAYGKQKATCDVTPDTSNSCAHSAEGNSSNAIIMVSQVGNGWGNVKYNIKSDSGELLYSGTLLSGTVGIDENCYAVGKCYTISTTKDPQMQNYVLFVMCGLVGSAPLTDIKFCVTHTGCKFDLSSAGKGGGADPSYGYGQGYSYSSGSYSGYSSGSYPGGSYGSYSGYSSGSYSGGSYGSYSGGNYGSYSGYSSGSYQGGSYGSYAFDDTYAADDDFPVNAGSPVPATTSPSMGATSSDSTLAPTTMGVTSPPSKPPVSTTASPTFSSGALQVADIAYNLTLSASTVQPLDTLNANDMLFVTYAIRRALELADIKIWDVSTASQPISTTSVEHSLVRVQDVYLEKVFNLKITISVILGSSGLYGTVDTVRHSLQVTFNSGLLEQLLNQALNYQMNNPSSTPMPQHQIHHVKPISLAEGSTTVPVLQPAATAPAVSGAYNSMWTTPSVDSSNPISTGFLVVITVSATISVTLCLLLIFYCLNRRRIRYDKVRIVDMEEEGAYDAETPSTNQSKGAVGLARTLGERRERRESDVVTIAFNNQLIQEERPQAVI